MDPTLRDELLAMAAEDEETRARLAAGAASFDGYHPELELVHRRNAAELMAIIDAHGWPGRALVGDTGADAAWRIAHHSVGEPHVMRRAVGLVCEAAKSGDVPGWHAAQIVDRIAVFEGRPQVYGTELDWTDEGTLGVVQLDDPSGVDARRAALGLPPLAEQLARAREKEASAYPGRGPVDADRRELAEWARRTGWR
ncbi:MAG TPA: DUF6624 domain-containing protein [Polyangiaceae bacterium]|nr:DUF6624 domain-containing protein [Polyangiaceae bacterium]